MMALLTLFTIAVVGVVGITAFKVVEEQTGKKLFLPDFILRRDDAIRHGITAVVIAVQRRTKRYLHKASLSVWRMLLRVFRQIVENKRFRPKARLEKNGNGSVYLKEIVEHKNTVRRENGYHE